MIDKNMYKNISMGIAANKKKGNRISATARRIY